MTMNEHTQNLPLVAGSLEAPANDDQQTRERRRRVQRLIKRALLAAGAALVALALVRALLPDPLAVEVATAGQGPLRVTVDETGRTRVRDRYVISAPVAGRLARIGLRPGDSVEEQALIASLTPMPSPLLDPRTRAEMQARLSAARFAERQAHTVIAQGRSNLAQATRDAQRARALAASAALTAAELERSELALQMRADELASAEFAAKVADEELRRAQAALGKAPPSPDAGEVVMIRAPVGGQVLRLIQQSEGIVPAGAPLVELGDPTALEVVVDVLTADAVGIRPGARASIESWGGPGALGGRVRRVEPSAFTRLSALGVEEQRVNVVIDLDGPEQRWRALGDGFRVEARIVAWEAASTLIAPSGAVIRAGDGWAVYRLDAGDRARLRPVKIGQRNARAVQIQEGLTAGDRLVLYPSDRLRDGMEVKVRGP
jgi:HlyD family secretion protein